MNEGKVNNNIRSMYISIFCPKTNLSIDVIKLKPLHASYTQGISGIICGLLSSLRETDTMRVK